jgi:hypothetical protein
LRQQHGTSVSLYNQKIRLYNVKEIAQNKI